MSGTGKDAHGTRRSALWGKGERHSALWGKGGRGTIVALCLSAILALPVAATAAPTAKPTSGAAYVPAGLLADAQANPGQQFRVIVELKSGGDTNALVSKVKAGGSMSHRFKSIAGVSATLPGALVQKLAQQADVASITPDAPAKKADTGSTTFTPSQVWEAAVGADTTWSSTTQPATIAIVDSGVDTSRAADFGARVVGAAGLAQTNPGVTTDGEGHGTFVSSIAAGSSSTHPGVAPGANIVNLRVMDNSGMAYTSDVIAAADWILQNKATYNIKVANFSLLSTAANTFRHDPLDHAVENLWFSGVTVVAAAGNQGTGSAAPMLYAPANDPFVITVGAVGTNDTVSPADDTVAPWSAFGPTGDGFRKPELSAPGRYMIGAVSPDAGLYTQRADRVVEPGYMQLSGTSFAAPVVSGAAAVLAGMHPDWTPGQIKGALMQSASALPLDTQFAGGVGEVNLAAAAALTNPPNPDAALEQFVVADPSTSSGYAFDSVSWESAVRSNVSWDSVSWSSVSWESVSWSSVSWESVSWESVSWSSDATAQVSWESVSWESVSWSSVSWSSVSWESTASSEGAPE